MNTSLFVGLIFSLLISFSSSSVQSKTVPAQELTALAPAELQLLANFCLYAYHLEQHDHALQAAELNVYTTLQEYSRQPQRSQEALLTDAIEHMVQCQRNYLNMLALWKSCINYCERMPNEQLEHVLEQVQYTGQTLVRQQLADNSEQFHRLLTQHGAQIESLGGTIMLIGRTLTALKNGALTLPKHDPENYDVLRLDKLLTLLNFAQQQMGELLTALVACRADTHKLTSHSAPLFAQLYEQCIELLHAHNASQEYYMLMFNDYGFLPIYRHSEQLPPTIDGNN